MSSFKRKTTSRQLTLPPGTRLSPSSASTVITSTGIASLDDILGGGLPLSCSLLVLAPDEHSAYGELVQKYFIAQGLSCGQNVYVVRDGAIDFVRECMWVPRGQSDSAKSGGGSISVEDEDEHAATADEKIKIAWRYEQMKQFQTTVPVSSSWIMEDYCRTFDLTTQIPASTLQQALHSGQLSLSAVSGDFQKTSLPNVTRNIANVLSTHDAQASTTLRICISSLGSPEWGDINAQQLLRFLYNLHILIRKRTNVCVSVSISPHLCTDDWGGPGWINKLAWLFSAALTLSAFSANPSLSALFPAHHGLVHIHALPAPHTLLPPSDRFSILRGLSKSGENNLAFKCLRKRLVFETLHLDLEGGVAERRTNVPSNAAAWDEGLAAAHDNPSGNTTAASATPPPLPIVIEVESKSSLGTESGERAVSAKVKKPRRKVAFQSDKPDIFDF